MWNQTVLKQTYTDLNETQMPRVVNVGSKELGRSHKGLAVDPTVALTGIDNLTTEAFITSNLRLFPIFFFKYFYLPVQSLLFV